MYNPGILVIDDDLACLRMISTKALDDSKYQIFTASSCAEGITHNIRKIAKRIKELRHDLSYTQGMSADSFNYGIQSCQTT